MYPTSSCECHQPDCRQEVFECADVAVERSENSTRRVELYCCTKCDQFWLRLALVDDGSAAWGKWYRGAITSADALNLTAESAAALMRAMKWHFYGGSYYRSPGEFAGGPIPVEPSAGAALLWAA